MYASFEDSVLASAVICAYNVKSSIILLTML